MGDHVMSRDVTIMSMRNVMCIFQLHVHHLIQCPITELWLRDGGSVHLCILITTLRVVYTTLEVQWQFLY